MVVACSEYHTIELMKDQLVNQFLIVFVGGNAGSTGLCTMIFYDRVLNYPNLDLM